jgi:hypothetical protein
MQHARTTHGSLSLSRRLRAIGCGLGGALTLSGCASLGSLGFSASPPAAAPDSVLEIYRQAQLEQIHGLEREVQRLRGELHAAESAMVAIESGLRGVQTRADAVSALAEARISVERARTSAPWRAAEIAELTQKLDEAERQFQSGNSGSAVFFASRAKRVAEAFQVEARRATDVQAMSQITAPRANLRAGPSTEDDVLHVLDQATPVLPQRSDGEWVLVQTLDGAAGWVHASLLGAR